MKTKFFLLIYCLSLASANCDQSKNFIQSNEQVFTAEQQKEIKKLQQEQTEIEARFNKGLSPPIKELQGFIGLTFWSLPSNGKEAFIQKLKKLLESKGQVTVIDEEKGLNFEGFKTDAIVYLSNHPILIQDSHTSTNIECIKLKVMTPVIIQKNGRNKQADIYEKSIYINTPENINASNQTSLDLISQLLNEFFLANPRLEGKAQFFIYN